MPWEGIGQEFPKQNIVLLLFDTTKAVLILLQHKHAPTRRAYRILFYRFSRSQKVCGSGSISLSSRATYCYTNVKFPVGVFSSLCSFVKSKKLYLKPSFEFHVLHFPSYFFFFFSIEGTDTPRQCLPTPHVYRCTNLTSVKKFRTSQNWKKPPVTLAGCFSGYSLSTWSVTGALKRKKKQKKQKNIALSTHNAVCQRSNALSPLWQALCLVSPLGLH